MKNNKKGVTLVELVICCFIIVILGGACTAVLMSGEHIYSTSAETAGAQLDSDLLQTYMMKLVPPADGITQTTISDAKSSSTGNYLYFDDENDNAFTVCINGDSVTIGSIKDFKYVIQKAGDSSSPSARAQFAYKVTLSDGSEFNGGFVMSNIPYTDDLITIDATEGYADLKAKPVCLSVIPESAS